MSELYVDEDWKARAQREKEELARQFGGATAAAKRGEGKAQPFETPTGASLNALVQSLGAQAAALLGLAPDPLTGRAHVDLNQARYTIDLLEVLWEKTKGNRTEEEERLLSSVLHELRLAYAEVASPRGRKRAPTGTQDPFA
jgi:hypothetical protein